MQIERVTTSSQIFEVERLGKVIWELHYTPIIGEAQVAYMLEKFQSKNAIENQIEEGYEYYLINDDTSVGYLSIQKRDEALFLSKFYVLASERGKGYGKFALEFINNRALELECDAIELTVNKYNSKTIGAYHKMGFETVEDVIFDIGSGYIMDDYRMRKSLNL
ncbi:GNAT family N-acetyltransferase [Winogradskyella sp. 3972H.M.0a.05]|uniref:GNAT family N-acetyltransferase n=1 Tax=Winogradskyella sp. 3972H.M.0a.05 TaxID=2950277 RepID=UPI003398B9E6